MTILSHLPEPDDLGPAVKRPPVMALVPAFSDFRAILLRELGPAHAVVKAALAASDSDMLLAREELSRNKAAAPLKLFIGGQKLLPYPLVQFQLVLPEEKIVPLVVSGIPDEGIPGHLLELKPGDNIVVANILYD